MGRRQNRMGGDKIGWGGRQNRMGRRQNRMGGDKIGWGETK